MELNTILDFLKKHGFKIIYSHLSEGCFGNIIIKVELNNGYIIAIVKDRGIYECFFEIEKWIVKKSIPIIAVIKILANESFNIADTTFDCVEEMLDYLLKHQQQLDTMSEKDIKIISSCWKLNN